MTTSNFPANTFSIRTGPRRNPALVAIAERQRRVHRWSRPLAAAIIATAATFTGLAAFRDGGRAIEANWRDASRTKVVVRHIASGPTDGPAVPPSTPAAPTEQSPVLVATLTGSVPGLIGPARTPRADDAEAAPTAPSNPEAVAAAPTPKTRPPEPSKPAAPKPVAPARAKSQLGALDKLGSDITSKLK